MKRGWLTFSLALCVALSVRAQVQVTEPLDKCDLVFQGEDASFACGAVSKITGSDPCHVAMFIGNGMVAEATANEPHAVHKSTLASMQTNAYRGARMAEDPPSAVQQSTMLAYADAKAARTTYYDHNHLNQKGGFASGCDRGVSSCWDGFDYYNEFDCVGFTERTYEFGEVNSRLGAIYDWSPGTGCSYEGNFWQHPFTLPAWQFDSCLMMQPQRELSNGVALTASAPKDYWRFYSFTMPANVDHADVALSASADVDLYIRAHDLPSTSVYDCKSTSLSGNESCRAERYPFGSGYWYVGVRGRAAGVTPFTIRVDIPAGLDVYRGGSGTVTSTPAGINCGATCTHEYPNGSVVRLTATPAAGTAFAGWWGTACDGSRFIDCDVPMRGAQAMTAYFGTTCGYAVGIGPTQSDAGWLFRDTAYNCDAYVPGYLPGTPVVVRASPDTFYGFSHWSAVGSGSFSSVTANPTTFTPTGNSFITGHFYKLEPVEVLQNGGFENAAGTGNSAPPWTVTPDAGHTLIRRSDGLARTGIVSALLGGSNSAGDALSQTFFIPAKAVVATVTLWVNVTTTESPGLLDSDRLHVVASANNNAYPLASLSDQTAYETGNLPGKYLKVGPFSLLTHRGSSVTLSFTVDNDFFSNPTSFRIDDVSVMVAAPGITPTTFITAPAAGATLSGNATVNVSASNDGTLAKLELLIDDVVKTSTTTRTLSYVWNTALMTNGLHTITSRATDANGNGTLSAPVVVTVSNALLAAPSNLTRVIASASQVNLSWSAVPGAASYRVYRKSNNGAYALIASPTATSFVNSGLTANTTYLYQVSSADAAGNIGPAGGTTIATTIVFTNAPSVGLVTPIRASDVLQLRTAVNAMRAATGLVAVTFTTITSGGLIKAVHITELRTRLNEARIALGRAAITYTDPTLTVRTTKMKAVHVQELRNGVR